MLANGPKGKQQTPCVIVSKKKDPCELCRHELQKQVMKHSVSLCTFWCTDGYIINDVTLSVHSIIFSSLNIIIRTVEKVKFNALLQ